MKILTIANSRFKGGASGGDKIYESFVKYWPCSFRVWDMQDIDYKPFFLCYLHRCFLSWFMALIEPVTYDLVYTASDFLPDSIAGFIFKLKGCKWAAGFYLKAVRDNPIHYYTQKVVRKLIDRFADMVIVTNPTMYDIFPNKKKTWINGGIDLKLAGLSDEPKIYDAVFCGRIHPSKGIDELLEIWDLVREQKPRARLAIIGDGDLGRGYIVHKLFAKHGLNKYNGIDLLGYMGDERYLIYKKSRIVLYPTPLKYDHFSMAPVEAMACGCPCLSFETPVINAIKDKGWLALPDKESIIHYILNLSNKERSDQLNLLSKWAIETSKIFDYEKQSMRVYNDIRKELHEDSYHWRAGHGGDSSMPNLKIA